jgi:hypothetical protein
VVAFVLATCVRVWLGPLEVLPRVEAQIPDSGRQRQELLDETRQTNRLLNQILSTLKSGTLNVRVASTDKKSGGLTAPGRPAR